LDTLLKYLSGDWVMQWGIAEHHLRIISTDVDAYGIGRYRIFDTTWTRGYADYDWKLAKELEGNSVLVQHAANEEHLQSIFQLCAYTQYLKYSIRDRQDCESLQRWIHTGGREEYRWCPQIWVPVAALGLALAFNTVKTYEPQAPNI